MAANPAQLFLLADHVKLSLLERQRAVSLNLAPNSHDGQISRSLESLDSGIQALEAQLSQNPDESVTPPTPLPRPISNPLPWFAKSPYVPINPTPSPALLC